MAAPTRMYTISPQIKRRQALYTLKSWLPILTMLLAGLGIATYVFLVVPLRQIQDMQGGVQRNSVGIVSSVTPGIVTKTNISPPDTVEVMLNGKSAMYFSSIRLQSGEHVQVISRIGKSGRVYVEDVKPDQEAKP